MSSGEATRISEGGSSGFTALELLIGIALALLVVVGSSPLISSMEKTGAREADRAIAVLQGRVAASRFEKDLRTATSTGCPFPVDGPILQATSRQIVFLGCRGGAEGLTLIEWEIVGSTLMRRWGPCPLERPESFPHSLYVDNKSMLQGLASDASFSYEPRDAGAGPVPEVGLSWVRQVALLGGGEDSYGKWPLLIRSITSVGR